MLCVTPQYGLYGRFLAAAPVRRSEGEGGGARVGEGGRSPRQPPPEVYNIHEVVQWSPVGLPPAPYALCPPSSDRGRLVLCVLDLRNLKGLRPVRRPLTLVRVETSKENNF